MSGNVWAKVAILVTSLLAIVGIVIVAIMLGQSRELRDADPKLTAAVAYGSAYVLPAATTALAVGVALETGTIAPQDPSTAGKFDSRNVVQFFSKDPTKTVVNYNDKVRVFFPQAGLWYTRNSGSQYLTGSFDSSSDVTIAPALSSDGTAPTSGPVEAGYPVQLFETSADQSDMAFTILSQATAVRVVPAAVFGAAGFAGA